MMQQNRTNSYFFLYQQMRDDYCLAKVGGYVKKYADKSWISWDFVVN